MAKDLLQLIRDDHRRIASDLDTVVARAGIAAAMERARTTTIVSNSDTGTVTGTSTTTTGVGPMSGMTGPIPSISGPAPSVPGTAPGSIHTPPGGIGTTGTVVSREDESWMEHSDEMFADFKAELSLHMEGEEAILYPLLKERFPETFSEAARDHRHMKALLERMDGFRWKDAS
ncbi:MAG TPA: hemerythrin domain-containing protein, partial [Methanomicrobiales archaeon]|nr:hemerythrin domain-containing protein [Methanomicrobiales archaeon]